MLTFLKFILCEKNIIMAVRGLTTDQVIHAKCWMSKSTQCLNLCPMFCWERLSNTCESENILFLHTNLPWMLSNSTIVHSLFLIASSINYFKCLIIPSKGNSTSYITRSKTMANNFVWGIQENHGMRGPRVKAFNVLQQ